MSKITLSSDHFQYWRQALNPDLGAEVDLANSTTPDAPWRVRLMFTKERLHWWHLWKTTVCRYQLLKHLQGNEYELIRLKDQTWYDRDLAMRYLQMYNAAGPGVPDVMPGTYRHFRGSLYQVKGTAWHSETRERFVVYESPLSERMWVRPIEMFSEMVEHEGKTVPRFAFVPPSPARKPGRMTCYGEELWAEDECTKHDPDHVTLEKAWVKLFGTKYDPDHMVASAAEDDHTIDTFPDGITVLHSYDGASIFRKV